jgi:hypothetical protein
MKWTLDSIYTVVKNCERISSRVDEGILLLFEVLQYSHKMAFQNFGKLFLGNDIMVTYFGFCS